MLDVNTKFGIHAIAALMLTAAKTTLEQTGECAVAVLFPADNSEPMLVEPSKPLDEPGKDEWADRIRRAAASNNFAAVFFACEAIRTEVSEENPTPVSQEILDAWIEHREFGLLQWEANVIRGEGVKVRTTPFRARPAGVVSGRFSGFLKNR